MIEKLINVVFWTAELNSRSCDPILNEYRGYQWRMVVSTVGALFFLLIGWLLTPGELPNARHFAIVAPVLAYFQVGLDLLVMVCCIVFLANAVQLWRFCEKYGISE
jgi:hypothetical protein